MDPATRDIVILDLEAAVSPDACRFCQHTEEEHGRDPWGRLCRTAQSPPTSFQRIGWGNKAAMGLSLGAYYSYSQDRLTWFDRHTLESVVETFVRTRPFLVSFNGITFDFALMRAVLRQEADALLATSTSSVDHARARHLEALCDAFKTYTAGSYDLLDAIWQADPASKKVQGVNRLDTLCAANGLPTTVIPGALMPQHWQRGDIALVANHCADDVYVTKALFERVVRHGELARQDYAPVTVRVPADLPHGWFPMPLPLMSPMPTLSWLDAPLGTATDEGHG